MPRTARAVEGGMIYHVLNRGNGRMRLFHKPADYAAFEKMLAEACKRYAVVVLAYCLMPNHWHLVVCPRGARDLARFIGWLCVTHVRRHHAHYHTQGGGHIYQGRFKSFPVQDDPHLLTLLRYVEANAKRAGLAKRAQDWQWCSLYSRGRREGLMPLSYWPVDRPRDWVRIVNQPLLDTSLKDLRACVVRGRPFGSPDWVEKTARRLGLGFTLRSVGRPRKNSKSVK